MTTSTNSKGILIGMSLIIGLSLQGLLISKTMLIGKQADRSVEVKGLAEKEVKANIVVWPISYSLADNDLGTLNTRLSENNLKIASMLKSQGLGESEYSEHLPAISDKWAREFSDPNSENAKFRYTASQTILVYSSKVDKVREAMKGLTALIKEGIPISGDPNGMLQTQYVFTDLNSVKPEMVETATKNAREVALKFAKDSGSKLGNIKKASQGQFTIEDRDPGTPYIKKVRVVNTVEYSLVD